MTKVQRMWVNQPSTLQPHHTLHGVNVLAAEEYPGTMRVWFLLGATESSQMFTSCLSPGWREQAARITEGLSIAIERLTLRHFLWAAKPRGDMLAYLTALTQEAQR